MTQTKQEAAFTEYDSPYSFGEYSNTEISKVEREAFTAGWEAGQPKWIPVTERLPEELVPVLVLIPGEDNEIAICLYEKREGFYLSYDTDFTPNVEFWCPIPESLLNFKP